MRDAESTTGVSDRRRTISDRAAKRSRTAARKKILVVDDNIDLAVSLKLLLEVLGHTVECAYDGHAALSAAKEFGPDIVILDIGLPGINGYEIARRLRAEFARKDLLLIAATGYGQAQDCRRSREAGFDFHLVKPLEFDRLRSIIAGHSAV